MKPQNTIIYHCQRCGRVVYREPQRSRPTCCGREMAKAAEETLRSAEISRKPQATSR